MILKKIKEILLSIKFRLSDLFLTIGFIPMVVFLVYGQEFMQQYDPNYVPLKMQLIVPLFVLLIVSWGIYVYLEAGSGNKANKYINFAFLFLFILGVVGVLIQPRLYKIEFLSFSGNPLSAELLISDTHYLFFSVDITSILFFIYIALFIFPKRFSSYRILQIIGFAVFFGCFFLNIYSYIVEKDNYIPFIKSILNLDLQAMKDYCMKSCILNSNAYGMMMMIGIICCCINHSISKKIWYLPLSIFYLINMLFSFCRASLIMSIAILFIYVCYYVVAKQKNARNKIVSFLIFIGLGIIFILTILLLFYVANIDFIAFFLGTVSIREMIWFNTYQIINNSMPLSFFFGNGFGIINEVLLQMNYESGFGDRYLFPTHNGYLNLFAEGGIIYLFLYLILLAYVIYTFIKCRKKQPLTSLAVLFGVVAFSFYSLIETIHYLVYPFMFLVFVLSNNAHSSQKPILND